MAGTKAVIYARFSPRPNADQCESVENQISELREYCMSSKWDIASEHSDEALSGNDVDRPGLWAAVSSMKRGYVLVVTKVDRLARDYLLFADIERRAKKHGWRIISADGIMQMEMTPERQLIAGILANIAEYQRKVTAARTKTRMLDHQRRGRSISGIAPFGAKIDPDDPKRLLACESELQVVERAKSLRADGLSYRKIIVVLEDEGYTPREGGWSPIKVQRIVERKLDFA